MKHWIIIGGIILVAAVLVLRSRIGTSSTTVPSMPISTATR